MFEKEQNSFELNVGGNLYLSGEITAEFIIENIDKLEKNQIDFLILMPKKPIQDSIYIQSICNFIVEIRLESSAEASNHYSYMTDSKEEVIGIFLKYFIKEEIPNLSEWKDISKRNKFNIFTKLFKK